MIKAESQKLYFSSAFGFLLIFLNVWWKKSRGLKASRKPRAKGWRISGIKSWKMKKADTWKSWKHKVLSLMVKPKVKNGSFIIQLSSSGDGIAFCMWWNVSIKIFRQLKFHTVPYILSYIRTNYCSFIVEVDWELE